MLYKLGMAKDITARLNEVFGEDFGLLQTRELNKGESRPKILQEELAEFLVTGKLPSDNGFTPGQMLMVAMVEYSLKSGDPTKIMALYKMAGIAEKVETTPGDDFANKLLALAKKNGSEEN